jgi:hypothetical protein
MKSQRQQSGLVFWVVVTHMKAFFTPSLTGSFSNIDFGSSGLAGGSTYLEGWTSDDDISNRPPTTEQSHN